MTALLLFVWLVIPASSDGQPPYDRTAWPHWAGHCPDVRQLVLLEESRRPVTRTPDGCRVLTGEWLDPYTGELVTSPAALDVDHVLPLAAAHRAGGWRWSRERRRAYANDLTDPDHLVAVTARANRAKGDRGPSRWLPRAAYQCVYVATYARIAARWALTLPAADRHALARVAAECDP